MRRFGVFITRQPFDKFVEHRKERHWRAATRHYGGLLTLRCCPDNEPAAAAALSMRPAKALEAASHVQLTIPACAGLLRCRRSFLRTYSLILSASARARICFVFRNSDFEFAAQLSRKYAGSSTRSWLRFVSLNGAETFSSNPLPSSHSHADSRCHGYNCENAK
jgi:hypothetical protein